MVQTKQWERIGNKRRAGVAAPLFSLYSSSSVGIGELPDLRLLVDWCKATGMSLVQLLPMNEVGYGFCPYDAQSSFALEPMYLGLTRLIDVDIEVFRDEKEALRKKFPTGMNRINYGIKQAKIGLLWEIYQKKAATDSKRFVQFLQKNQFWVRDYALFKVIKERFGTSSWEEWPRELRNRDAKALAKVEQEESKKFLFHQWIQWQLYEQFSGVKQDANGKGVFLLGDFPFLVSRDSADAWAHQEYFKLGFSSGAPPDAFYHKGQRWGSPPYDWKRIELARYDYLIEKLKFAQNFYDILRVDHVIGFFRVWTIPIAEPLGNAGLNGSFDPKDEPAWEDHGRRILKVMIENTSMLLCGEDLGTVPECSYKVLEEFGIPGMEVQRWTRDWNGSGNFKDPSQYRKISIATLGTHDMSPLGAWWEYEAKLDEKAKFWKCIGMPAPVEEKCSTEMIRAALDKINRSASIFSIQFLQDWLSLDGFFLSNSRELQINFPGTVSEKNWSLVLPLSLEDFLALPINSVIQAINVRAGRG